MDPPATKASTAKGTEHDADCCGQRELKRQASRGAQIPGHLKRWDISAQQFYQMLDYLAYTPTTLGCVDGFPDAVNVLAVPLPLASSVPVVL